MLNKTDIVRGYIDTIILSRLEQKDVYGYEIIKEVLTLSNHQFEIKEATLYSAFRRLEADGLIVAYWGDENVGARRKYYSLLDKGKEVLNENKKDWEHIRNILNILILNGGKHEQEN